LTKKVLEALEKQKADNEEKFLEFYKDLGHIMKEGLVSASEYRDKILDILMFESSADAKKLTSLEGYVSRMKPEQKEMYYLSGESRKKVEASPHLEALLSKGYEVLFMTDAVDEFILPSLHEFKGKLLKSIGKGEVELGSDLEKEEKRRDIETLSKDFEPFLKALEKELQEWISTVRLSGRLVSSPACLVGSEYGFSAHVERLMAQNKMEMPKQKRILEINPKSEVIEKMNARFRVVPDDHTFPDNAKILYNTALLAEGASVDDPAAFSKLLTSLMARAV
jgi:molecular chaperone HtpG